MFDWRVMDLEDLGEVEESAVAFPVGGLACAGLACGGACGGAGCGGLCAGALCGGVC